MPPGAARFAAAALADAAIGVARFLNNIGLVKFVGGNVQTPVTLEEGESDEFYKQYIEIVNTLATLQAN